MTKFQTIGLVIAGIVISVFSAVLVADEKKVSGVYNQVANYFGNGLYIGEVSGTSDLLEKVVTTSCNASTTELPLEATSTDAFSCTITGARSGDNVYVSLPYTSDVSGGLILSGRATASSDTITFGVTNLSGAATSSFPLATTSVQVTITR